MALLGVGLVQSHNKSLGDYTLSQVVGSVFVDAKPVVTFSIRKSHLID